MDKTQATIVLRDVLAECAGSILPRCVLLEPASPQTLENAGHYEVHLACMVDDDLRRCIEIVVNKHQLSMRQDGNRIILYRDHAKDAP